MGGTVVFDARQSNLQEVASYARATTVLVGLLRTVSGGIVCGLGALLLWIGIAGYSGPRKPDDSPPWLLGLLGAALASWGFVLVTGGIGRMVSAFAADCHFRAGQDGLAVRVPVQGWFGIFKVVDYQFPWEQIETIYPLTHSVNLIPISRELHIRLYGGKEIVIQRSYFDVSSKRLSGELLKIKSQAGK